MQSFIEKGLNQSDDLLMSIMIKRSGGKVKRVSVGKCAAQIWQRLYFQVNSRSRRLFDLIQTINLIYIAIFTPLVIGFSMEMNL